MPLALENSKKMPKALLHLNNLLRHIVYECKDNKTMFAKEIEAIKWYITILQLRYEKPLPIVINTPTINNEILIPCTVLLTLFENAIKHSNIGQEANSCVSLTSSVTNNYVTIIVSNTISKNIVQSQPNGIGLNNIRKKIELLYPNQDILTTEVNNITFVAKLNIPL